MKVVPINQKDANKFVMNFHRHHKPVVGSIFQIGCEVDSKLIGVAICGRPVARKIDYKKVIEVNRLCVADNQKNACSKLYSACARIAKEMGYKKIITFTLESESGISLKAAGWNNEGSAGCKAWNSSNGRTRTDQVVDLFGTTKKYPNEKKIRWSKILATTDGEQDKKL